MLSKYYWGKLSNSDLFQIYSLLLPDPRFLTIGMLCDRQNKAGLFAIRQDKLKEHPNKTFAYSFPAYQALCCMENLWIDLISCLSFCFRDLPQASSPFNVNSVQDFVFERRKYFISRRRLWSQRWHSRFSFFLPFGLAFITKMLVQRCPAFDFCREVLAKTSLLGPCFQFLSARENEKKKSLLREVYLILFACLFSESGFICSVNDLIVYF